MEALETAQWLTALPGLPTKTNILILVKKKMDVLVYIFHSKNTLYAGVLSRKSSHLQKLTSRNNGLQDKSFPRFQELHRRHVIQFPRVKCRDHQDHMAFLKYFLITDNAQAKTLVET